MNIQEQEHWDHENGCMSELQNAYQRSRMEIDTRGDTDRIKELKKQGKSFTVYWGEVFCPSTDAFIADVPSVDRVFDTEKEAKNYMIDDMGDEEFASSVEMLELCLPSNYNQYQKPIPKNLFSNKDYYNNNNIPF